MPGLQVRKLADKSEPREKVFDPMTGEAILMVPEDAAKLRKALQREEIAGLFRHTPRPFAGLEIEGKPPKRVKLPTSFVAKGIHEGWIEGVDRELVHRSSGPEEDPWGTPAHSFVHYSKLTFKTVDGDVVYKVKSNPDKWPEEKDGDAGFGGEVRWYYECSLESS